MDRVVRQPSCQLIKGESPYERSYGETPRPRVMRCNIYLHYVMDLWGRQWRRRAAEGGMIAVRYADDCVLGS